MRLLKIETSNFLPFTGNTSLDLSDIKAATVVGPNGVGKSSFFIDAILVAITGKSRKPIEFLISKTTNSMWVKVVISHNNRIYTIIRTVELEKPQKLTIFDGETDISERLLTSTQKKLDSILGLSHNLLLSTSISEQGEIDKISNMAPSEREKILSEMLRIDNWEAKRQKALNFISTQKNISQRISDLQLEIDTYNHEMTTSKTSLTDKIIQRDLINKNLDDIKQELKTHQDSLKESQQYYKLQVSLSVIKSEIENLRKQIAEIPAGNPDEIELLCENEKLIIENNKNLINEITSSLKDLGELKDKNQSKISEIQSLVQLNSKASILTRVPCANLPIYNTCELLFSAKGWERQIEKFLSENGFETLEQGYILLKENNETISKFITDGLKDKEDLLNENRKLETSIENNKTLLFKLKGSFKISMDLHKKISESIQLEDKLKVQPKFDSAVYEVLQLKHQTIADELNIRTIEIAKLQQVIETANNQVKRSMEKLQELKGDEAILANYNTLYKAYSDIPSLLFQDALPIIEEYANQILKRISPGKSVKIRPFRETNKGNQVKTLDIVVMTPVGELDFDLLSGSEKFRQSLAIRLAMSRYNSECNNIHLDFFIVDEGFGSLDEDNKMEIKLALQEIAKEFDLFLVITHVKELTDTFNKKIVVQPPGKGERILVVD